ncbi:MAG: acetolactate decarboxylase [Roseivirga sp.]|nr:acetolactate decarboxylase [Roseivirga sp.]
MSSFKSYIILILLTITFCAFSQDTSNSLVSHYGILREIMREQKLDANADLRDFAHTKNLYAMGALEGLAGEILIINGQPFNGIAENGKLRIEKSFERKATLLVSAQVTDWSETKVEVNVGDLKELEMEIKRMALANNIDTSEAFPFLIKGTAKQLEWHVINAAEASEKTHEAFKEAGLKGNDMDQNVEILGFYSENHQGIFTHHGSFLHLHFKDRDDTKMGHVDNLMLNGSVTVMLPKTEKP